MGLGEGEPARESLGVGNMFEQMQSRTKSSELISAVASRNILISCRLLDLSARLLRSVRWYHRFYAVQPLHHPADVLAEVPRI